MGRINAIALHRRQPLMNRQSINWVILVFYGYTHQELGGRVFEYEYDLALVIINDIENRDQQGNYSVERLMFN